MINTNEWIEDGYEDQATVEYTHENSVLGTITVLRTPRMVKMSEYFREKEQNDPLISGDKSRLNIFPIRYPEIWKLYKQHEASYWTSEEIDLENDLNDWANLMENERTFIEKILAFFAASDGIVLENLSICFIQELQCPEVRAFYAFQAGMENCHGEVYSLLIDAYIKDKDYKKKMLDAVHQLDSVKNKAIWAAKWMGSHTSITERLVAYACVEGILFSGSFCAIFWMKKRGKLPGLSFSNELIARDEGLHCTFACLLYNSLQEKLPDQVIYDIVCDAVQNEEQYIDDILPADLIGMNKKLMTEYIKYVADRLLCDLGVSKFYNAENTFDFMDMISVQGKTNFFEKRVGDYQKSGILASPRKQIFCLDAEF